MTTNPDPYPVLPWMKAFYRDVGLGMISDMPAELSKRRKLIMDSLAKHYVEAQGGWSREQILEALAELGARTRPDGDMADQAVNQAIRDILAGVWKSAKCPPQQPQSQSAEEIAARPGVVCLCGSTRFMDAFFEAGWQCTLAGEIVLSVGVCKHAEHHGAEALGQDVADRLDELHLRKIDMADRVFILNVGGYIGESTQRELDYAVEHGKPVTFLEPREASHD